MKNTEDTLGIIENSSWLDPTYFINDFNTFYYGTSLDISGLENTNSLGNIPKNYIMVVDVSGSMGGAINDVKQMIMAVSEILGENDKIAVVTFSDSSKVIFPLQKLSENSNFKSAVDTIRATGSTNISAGLFNAVEMISNNSKQISIIMLLSDGEANKGIVDAVELQTKLKEHIDTSISKSLVVFHSFGFTESHDATMLSSVTAAGNLDNGMYYFIQETKDIKAAIGDCIGSFKVVSGYNITVTANSNVPGWKCVFLSNGTNIKSQSEIGNIGILTPHQKQTLVLATYPTFSMQPLEKMEIDNNTDNSIMIVPNITSELPILTVTIHYKHLDGTNMEIVRKVKVTMDQNNTIYFHVFSHVMRIRVAFALMRAMDPAAKSIIPELEALHDQLLVLLGKIQEVEGELMTQDEGLLVTLERDLGAVIENLHTSAGLAGRLKARFLQFANEHQNQRSASTGTHVRSTYATKEQSVMRSRFLSGEDINEKAIKEKGELLLEEHGLTEEEIKKRQEMDELTCFVSLESWRDTTLGLGLLVRPRTMRERRKRLMPVIELVEDYICADSYNSGVRVNFSKDTSNLDREDEEQEETHLAIKSSFRSRINGWLPLYINSTNWNYSKSWGASAFSIIATQFNDMFQPIHALKVCAKLMIQSVVKFTVTDGLMSEKATQMYCDVHRLFLAMAEAYPAIVEEADKAIEKFINEPESRTRRITPDLGDLIEYLTISSKYNWEHIREPYIIEAIRRSTLHMDHFVLAELDGVITGIDGILQYWDENTSSIKVTLFNVLFLTVLMPKGITISEIKANYDRRWGRLSNECLKQIKEGYQHIMNITSISENFEYFGIKCTRSAIAELLLWAFENKYDADPGIKYLPKGIPKSAGICVQRWRARVKLLRESRRENQPNVKNMLGPPQIVSSKKRERVSGVIELLNSKETIWDTQPSVELPLTKKARYEKRWEDWTPAESETPVSCVLFIGRLPRQVTVEELQTVFQSLPIPDLPPPTEIRISYNYKKKSNRYAFVTWPNADCVKLVIEYGEQVAQSYNVTGSYLLVGEKWAILDYEKGRTDPNFQVAKKKNALHQFFYGQSQNQNDNMELVGGGSE